MNLFAHFQAMCYISLIATLSCAPRVELSGQETKEKRSKLHDETDHSDYEVCDHFFDSNAQEEPLGEKPQSTGEKLQVDTIEIILEETIPNGSEQDRDMPDSDPSETAVPMVDSDQMAKDHFAGIMSSNNEKSSLQGEISDEDSSLEVIEGAEAAKTAFDRTAVYADTKAKAIAKAVAEAEAIAEAKAAIPKVQELLSDHTILKYSPRFIFHPDEGYYNSSVEYFFQHTRLDNGSYVTKEKLKCSNCRNPHFFKGTRPEEKPPTYAIVVDKKNGIVDVGYFMFFPYNLGKKVCIGLDGFNLGFFGSVKKLGKKVVKAVGSAATKTAGKIVEIAVGCKGVEKRFGNHVGDWEHVSVRFKDGRPIEMFLGAHGHGHSRKWSSFGVQHQGQTVYVAKGSHGMYLSPAKHVYRKLPNGGALIDVTANGTALNSSANLQIYRPRADGQYEDQNHWLNFRGRWGNPESGCDFVKKVAGNCILNGGPTGPLFKRFIHSQELR